MDCPLNEIALVFQLSYVFVSARGSETARVRDGTADVTYSTSNGLCAAFGPGNFDKNAPAMRMDFEVRLDDEDVLAFFDGLDAWVVQYIAEHAD